MPKKTDKIIEPINANMENVANKIIQPAAPDQFILDLGVQVEKVIDGIEMGVLQNGIPYLTQTGLASVCGVARSVIYDISQDWVKCFESDVFEKVRHSFIKEYLFTNGYKEPTLYIEIRSNGVAHYSYPDIVCMAIMDYYAFESRSKNEKALDSYRKFAKYGLQKFIYEAVGYQILDKWKLHNERQSLLRNSVPVGYFSVFHETNPLTLDLIHADLPVNDKTVPDISIGICWAKHWKSIKNNHTARRDYEHNYPSSYRQSKANRHIESNAYPDSALPEFRRWFREEYLTTKFPKYILTKANILIGGVKEATRIADTFKRKEITKNS